MPKIIRPTLAQIQLSLQTILVTLPLPSSSLEVYYTEAPQSIQRIRVILYTIRRSLIVMPQVDYLSDISIYIIELALVSITLTYTWNYSLLSIIIPRYSTISLYYLVILPFGPRSVTGVSTAYQSISLVRSPIGLYRRLEQIRVYLSGLNFAL